MTGQTDDRRRQSVAYDPARDTFTAAVEPDIKAKMTQNLPYNISERHTESSPISDLAVDVHVQQIKSSTPSRASPNSPRPPMGRNDSQITINSSQPVDETGVASQKSVPNQEPVGNSEWTRHESSPSVSEHTFLHQPRKLDGSNSRMAASPPKKRKLSQNSPTPRDPSSTEHGEPPLKKADTSTSHQDQGDVRSSRDTSDKPIYSKKRIPAKASKNARRPRNEISAYSRRDTPPPQDSRYRSRSRSPGQKSPDYRDRDSRRRSRSPKPISRSPSRSPPRPRKKPGGSARIDAAAKEAIKRRQLEREQAEQREGQLIAHERGVHDVVRQHYNSVPERGREWRKTDSHIKGLRSFNNWVKSAVIQKFSPDEDFLSQEEKEKDWGPNYDGYNRSPSKGLLVLDIGCGKGGDLGKWQQAPQPVDLYVGLDPAEISISQARDRYQQMRRGRGPRGGPPKSLFHGEFFVKDCFTGWIGEIPIVQQVGIDSNVGPGGNMMASRWGGGGGFDLVSMMFCMHYSFESEEKARGMLRNVAGSLKKGGRFIGVIPNSDVLSAKVKEFHDKRKQRLQSGDENEEGEVEEEVPEWGNGIYRVRFPGKTPEDGVFRPPFGWRYSFFLEEAVEEVPEYVVPWEAFRFIAEDYNLELQYRKSFSDLWKEEKDDRILGPLSERMGVRERGAGPLLVSDEEMEAASFYHAFCFYKV